MTDQFYKLNNPAWYGLHETHKEFGISVDGLTCYQKNIVAFAAWDTSNTKGLKRLDELIAHDESFFIIGEMADLPANYFVERIITCLQMFCTTEIAINTGANILQLQEKEAHQMAALTELVMPGYYKHDTRLMGDYYGIMDNNELVAMAGERIQLNGLTEVSAVVTHPAFTGRTYARQLVALVVNKNMAAGNIPFLHTGQNNHRAIRMYEHLGFKKRRIINFTKIKRLN